MYYISMYDMYQQQRGLTPLFTTAETESSDLSYRPTSRHKPSPVGRVFQDDARVTKMFLLQYVLRTCVE
jgi:hypothetical protein